LVTAGGNTIQGNYLGTDAATGGLDLGNHAYGLYVNNCANNTIGGTTVAARNVISGNDVAGVLLCGASATGNVVEGNYIGTDQSGTVALKNTSYGVYIISGAGNTIGGDGDRSGERNLGQRQQRRLHHGERCHE